MFSVSHDRPFMKNDWADQQAEMIFTAYAESLNSPAMQQSLKEEIATALRRAYQRGIDEARGAESTT